LFIPSDGAVTLQVVRKASGRRKLEEHFWEEKLKLWEKKRRKKLEETSIPHPRWEKRKKVFGNYESRRAFHQKEDKCWEKEIGTNTERKRLEQTLEERDCNKHWQKENVINVGRKRLEQTLAERECNKRWKKEIGINVGRKRLEQALKERVWNKCWKKEIGINVGRKRLEQTLKERDCNKRWKKEIGINVERKRL
jgi:hypothetical protein